MPSLCPECGDVSPARPPNLLQSFERLESRVADGSKRAKQEEISSASAACEVSSWKMGLSQTSGCNGVPRVEVLKRSWSRNAGPWGACQSAGCPVCP